MTKRVKVFLPSLIEAAVYEDQKQFENFNFDNFVTGDEIYLKNGGVVYFGFATENEVVTVLDKNVLLAD